MKKRLVATLAAATLVLVPSAIALASYTWTDVTGSTGSWYSLAVSDGGLIAYSSQHRLATPFEGRVWKTINGGNSWTELMSSPTRANWRFVSTSGDGATVAGVGYATNTAAFADILVSQNGGTTWTVANAEADRQWTGLAMSRDGQTIVAVAESTDGTNGVIKKSVNGGTSWTDITPAVPEPGTGRNYGGDWRQIAVSSDGTKVFAGLDNVGLYSSSNGGTTWTKTLDATSGLWTSIRTSGDGRYVIALNDFYSSANNGVWVSSDYGASWTKTSSGAGATAAAVSRDGTVMAFGRYAGRLFVSRDRGATWQVEDPASGNFVGVGLSESGERLIAVEEGGLARFATSTTTTTTTTTTTVAPSTSEAPATTTATTTAAATTAAPVVNSTSTTATTTASTTTSSTIVDSPPPAVSASMVESFAPKPLVKDTSAVAPGETVTVRISGFQPYELVSIGFDDGGAVQSQALETRALPARKVLLTVRADATGTISVNAKLPTTASGEVTLWAYGRESKKGFRQTLTVAELPDTGSRDLSRNVGLVGLLIGSGVVLSGLRRRLRR